MSAAALFALRSCQLNCSQLNCSQLNCSQLNCSQLNCSQLNCSQLNCSKRLLGGAAKSRNASWQCDGRSGRCARRRRSTAILWADCQAAGLTTAENVIPIARATPSTVVNRGSPSTISACHAGRNRTGTRPIIDPQLRHAPADGPYVAHQPSLHPNDPLGDVLCRTMVRQRQRSGGLRSSVNYRLHNRGTSRGNPMLGPLGTGEPPPGSA